jgi:hypothetical protein
LLASLQACAIIAASENHADSGDGQGLKPNGPEKPGGAVLGNKVVGADKIRDLDQMQDYRKSLSVFHLAQCPFGRRGRHLLEKCCQSLGNGTGEHG